MGKVFRLDVKPKITTPTFGDYVGALEASRILFVHPETVKRLIRMGKLPAVKFGNKWLMERNDLHVFAGTYDGGRGRLRKLL